MADPQKKCFPTPKRPKAQGGDAFNDDERAWIVTQFAMHLTPQQVADAFEEFWGRSVMRQQVNRYNADSASRRKMAGKWIQLHEEVRARFVEDIASIPIANRAMRLRQLQLHYDRAVARGNVVLAASLLEQAAKEAGNVHTNERKVVHSGKIRTEEVSEEEMRARLADRLAESWEKRAPAPVPSTLQ